MCARRGDILPAQSKFRDSIKTANEPPWPAGVQRFNSMKRTPRVVAEVPKKHCVKGEKFLKSQQEKHFISLPQMENSSA